MEIRMENTKLIAPTDGRVIEISRLNKWQLRDIHYQEEIKMAKRILELPPFSEERKQLLNKGYSFVETLKLHYEKQDENYSWGASLFSVKLVRDVVKKRIQDTKREVVVYEAGVGLGVTIRDIIEMPDIQYYGCDVSLMKETAELCNQYHNLFLNEATLYEDIKKMNDNSIDVFYADNVIEHLIPDEADEIVNILYRKMKKNGILVMLIPNWKDGPHDVTKYYLPKGTRATGFHFMEMSHYETLKLFGNHGFKPNYIVRDGKVEKDHFCIKNIGKVITEALVSKMKNEVARLELMKWDYYQVYILSK